MRHALATFKIHVLNWIMRHTKFFTKAFASVITLALLAQPTAHAAAPKPGTACKKAGLTQNAQGVTYICKKSGKKLVWAIALGVRKSPFPTPSPTNSSSPSPSPSPSPTSTDVNPQYQNTQNGQVIWNWMDNQGKWVANGTPPPCNLPIIPTGALLDFSKVLSLVQPGQIRGGSYKPHGGLRWSVYGTYTQNVHITVPFDGVVVQAWQYLVGGIYQFGVNIENPCGFMVRIGHMHVPSAQFSQILGSLPPAAENDSREYQINPPAVVKTGDVIATDVGMPAPAPADSLGAYIDFGLLDLRQVNPVLPSNYSTNADEKYSKYSLCWYQGGYLSPSDQALAAKLPFANGDATSDYCSKK